MKRPAFSEEEALENDEQPKPALKIQKRQKTTHYFDCIQSQILDIRR